MLHLSSFGDGLKQQPKALGIATITVTFFYEGSEDLITRCNYVPCMAEHRKFSLATTVDIGDSIRVAPVVYW